MCLEYTKKRYLSLLGYLLRWKGMQDYDYIIRFQDWDFDAFGKLYERYIDQIFGFVFRKTSDRAVAEDVTSQVWIKAMKGLQKFSHREWASFKSWIYRIAQNSVIDYYRSTQVEVDIEDIFELGFSLDMAQYIDNKDKLWEVQSFLSGLSPIEQEVVVLRVWDELSYKEIAELLGKKEDNCKQIYKRTMLKVHANIMMTCLMMVFFI